MYSSPFRRHTIDQAQTELAFEIKRMSGVTDPVLTADLDIRRGDSMFKGIQLQPHDRGVALYFRLHGKDRVLAADRFNKVEDNIWAIARHVEALRGQDRWFVGSVDQAFAGYTALPEPGKTYAMTWWTVLGVAHDAPEAVVRAAYLVLAKEYHPDRTGGDSSRMVEINAAWDQARAAYAQKP